MVRPQEIVTILLKTLQSSENVTDDISYLTQTADMSGGDSGVKLPVIEAEITDTTHLNGYNTDRDGFVVDDTGQQVGRVYRDEYELSLQLDVYVANGSSHNVDEIAQSVRTELYQYEDAGPDEPFRDDNGDVIDETWRFSVDSGTRQDDTLQTPTLRRWRQDLTVYAYHEYATDGSPIKDVSITEP